MIQNYFKIALRNIFRNKVYSLINIAGLAIGLAAAMLIILYSKDEVSYDRFHTNNPNIYRVVSQWIKPDGSLQHGDGNTGHFQGPKFKESIPEIKSYVRIKSDQRNIRKETAITSHEMLAVDANFFSVFTFPLIQGDAKTLLQQPKSVVISEKMAKKLFNSTNVLGQKLEISENEKFDPYLITGVAKTCPQNSSIKFDFLIPNIVPKEEYANNENWFNFFQNTFVLLEPKANLKNVVSKMKQVYESDAKASIIEMRKKFDVKEKAHYDLQAMTDMHLSTEFTAQNGLQDASNPIFSYILGGIAIFILLIACINFVNLTVARSLKRAKEIGVRKVVGGDRKQLIIQFLGESFMLCLIAFVLGIVLVELVLPTFNQLANKSLSLSYLFDIKLVIIFIATFLITALLAGFYPALVLSGYNPVQTLYGRFNLSGKNYLQKTLVVLQFGLASFLIIASLTIYSQFNYLISKPLGYNDKDLMVVNKWRMSHQEANLFKNELLKNASIEGVAPKNGGNWGTVAKVNGETQIDFAYETVDETFIPMLKIPILQGCNFSADFPSDSTKSVVVNEAFVKKAGWKSPIGQIVDFWFNKNEKYEVIGVIKNFHFNSLSQDIRPQLFTMKPGNGFGMFYIKIKPNSEVASIEKIEKTFKSVFPIASFEYEFKEAENIKNYESEAKWKQIMLFGAVLTIFISCIGLFGLATLSAEKRTKEIGVRKVLGASIGSIVALLSTDFVILVGISFFFSFPISYYAVQKWLENYPYKVDLNWWIFGFTASITICIALLTVGWQSIQAALMNPVRSLKME